MSSASVLTQGLKASVWGLAGAIPMAFWASSACA